MAKFHRTELTVQKIFNFNLDDTDILPPRLMFGMLEYKSGVGWFRKYDKLNQPVTGIVIALSTTAQKVGYAGGDDNTIPSGVKALTIQNDSTNTLYLGASNVASNGNNAGIALKTQGASYTLNNLDTSFTIYVVGSAASTTTRILYI